MGDTGWARMPKRISQSTVQAIADNLRDLVDRQQQGFAIVLHGGEPLLLGAKGLDRLLACLSGSVAPRCSLNIQTNGILITNEILDVCAKHNTSLSVSLDGPPEVHDRSRVGHKGQPTYALVEAGLSKLCGHRATEQLFSGLLAVIDPESDPWVVYHHLKSFGAPSIDFLHRDGNRSRLPQGKRAIDSTEYGEWLCHLLDIYLSDRSPPRVRVLDDLVKLTLGGFGVKEGVGLTSYGIVVIDTDGTITKNDTLKSAYDGADRFVEEWSVHTHRLATVVNSLEYRRFHELQRPTSSICRSCPELRVCGGGMPLHRWSDSYGYDNPSVYCADQKLLISRIRSRLRAAIGHS